MKLDRIHLFNKWVKPILLGSTAILILMTLPELLSAHLPLLIFLPCCNLLYLIQIENEFKMKILENKIHCPFEAPSDIDQFKMNSIEMEFQI